jgi:zinc protease
MMASWRKRLGFLFLLGALGFWGMVWLASARAAQVGQAAQSAQPAPYLLQGVKRWRTKHGVAVYYLHKRHLPMVDIRLVFDAGANRDGAAWGLASLVGNVWLQGQEPSLLQRFKAIGSILGIQVGRDSVTLSVRTLVDSKPFSRSIKLLHRSLVRPRWTQAQFAHLKQLRLQGLAQLKKDPGYWAGKRLRQALFGPHPYGHVLVGDQDTVARLQFKGVQAFYQRHYQQRSMRIYLIGDLSLVRAKKVAEKLASSRPLGRALPKLRRITRAVAPGYYAVHLPTQQTLFLKCRLGFPRLDAADDLGVRARIGSTMFGGSPLSSFLGQAMRVKGGLAYSPTSFVINAGLANVWCVQFQTAQGNLLKADATLARVWARFARLADAHHLALAKLALSRKALFAQVSNASVMGVLSQVLRRRLPVSIFRDYDVALSRVSVNDVALFYQHFLASDAFVTVTVGAQALSQAQASL